MPAPDPTPLVSDAVLDELSALGSAIYERLKTRLEPEHNERFVAIHIDTEEYVIARSSGDAMRAMLAQRPADGRLFVRRIGSEPEYGLAARFLATDLAKAGPAK
jgi:hypothetical protein